MDDKYNFTQEWEICNIVDRYKYFYMEYYGHESDEVTS